jgi:hypothetical protein
VTLPAQTRVYEASGKTEQRALTIEEVNLFEWISENIGKDDCIWADGHGGNWIPAVSYRRVANPPANPLLIEEARKGSPPDRITHFYFNKRYPGKIGTVAPPPRGHFTLLKRHKYLSVWAVTDGRALMGSLRNKEKR